MTVANPGRRPHDPAFAERARALRAERYKLREIAEALDVPISTVSQWICDPDGSRNKKRREKYRGTCVDCGASTYNGTFPPPLRCVPCTGALNRRWTPEVVVAAIRQWADKYGKPPSAMEWNTGHRLCAFGRRAEGDYPATSVVQYVFDSWNAAIEAAGFQPSRARGGPPGSLSKEELERTVALYQELGSLAAVARVIGLTSQGVRVRLGYAGVMKTKGRVGRDLQGWRGDRP